MAIEVQVRKWGNSIGIVIPQDIAKLQNIKEGDFLLIELVKRPDKRAAFGKFVRKESGQSFKDAVRKEW